MRARAGSEPLPRPEGRPLASWRVCKGALPAHLKAVEPVLQHQQCVTGRSARHGLKVTAVRLPRGGKDVKASGSVARSVRCRTIPAVRILLTRACCLPGCALGVQTLAEQAWCTVPRPARKALAPAHTRAQLHTGWQAHSEAAAPQRARHPTCCLMCRTAAPTTLEPSSLAAANPKPARHPSRAHAARLLPGSWPPVWRHASMAPT